MAIPTLTSISPNTGSTWGQNQVLLTGTNFRTVTYPPPSSYTSNDEQQTVRVWFDGEQSSAAYTLSDTEALAIVPEWMGPHSATTPYSVDVKIANLDDDGNEIATEDVTLTDGYAFDRPSLVKSTPFQRVIEELVALFRRHVLVNTSWEKSRDFDDDPSDHLDTVQRAGLPMIQLIGPGLTESKDWGSTEAEPEENPLDSTEYTRKLSQTTVHLNWQLDAFVSDRIDNEIINLTGAIIDFFKRIKWVKILSDPDDPTSTVWKHELQMPPNEMPQLDPAPVSDGLRHIRASFVVRGVDIGAQDLPTVEQGWTVYDADSPSVSLEKL